MELFSDRYGYNHSRPLDPILEDAPDWLKLGFQMEILTKFTNSRENSRGPSMHQLSLSIAYQFRVGGYSYEDSDYAWRYLENFMDQGWYRFYDVIELLGRELRKIDNDSKKNLTLHLMNHFTDYRTAVNQFFIDNNVAWRLDDDGTLKRELPVELKENLEQTEQEIDRFQPVKDHLDKAKRFVTQRPLDPENSIKETASALESLARIYYPNAKTLGAAVDVMKKEKAIHVTLALMIDKFYGFASDAPNVRHGAPVPSTVTLLEAEFCLFVGAAILRYLNQILDQKGTQSL